MNARRGADVIAALVVLGVSPMTTRFADARTHKPEVPPAVGKSVDFRPLRDRLMHSKGATVSSACGSVMWPWAYRGKLGVDRALRPYGQSRVNVLWVRDFVTLLFHEADWDSVSRFRGVSKPCDQTHDVPL